jgi:hypothetical protein
MISKHCRSASRLPFQGGSLFCEVVSNLFKIQHSELEFKEKSGVEACIDSGADFVTIPFSIELFRIASKK